MAKFCPNCGAPTVEGVNACPNCGAPYNVQNAAPEAPAVPAQPAFGEVPPQPAQSFNEAPIATDQPAYGEVPPQPAPSYAAPAQLAYGDAAPPPAQPGYGELPPTGAQSGEFRMDQMADGGFAAPVKKKSKAGKIILIIAAVVLLLFVGLIVIGIIFGGKSSDSDLNNDIVISKDEFEKLETVYVKFTMVTKDDEEDQVEYGKKTLKDGTVVKMVVIDDETIIRETSPDGENTYYLGKDGSFFVVDENSLYNKAITECEKFFYGDYDDYNESTGDIVKDIKFKKDGEKTADVGTVIVFRSKTEYQYEDKSNGTQSFKIVLSVDKGSKLIAGYADGDDVIYTAEKIDLKDSHIPDYK